MWKVTWRNLMARKLRLALSGFAIVLGVAFVAGSFIFTDALGGSFNGIVSGTTSDVEVAPKGANDFDSMQDTRTIPASVVDKINALPEVDRANGVAQMQGVYIIGADGKLVGGNGPPGFAFNYTDTRSLTGDRILSLADGELPSGPGEVALDEAAADKAGYQIGDTVTLVTPIDPPTMKATLTGLVEFGSEGRPGRSHLVGVRRADHARRLLRRQGRLHQRLGEHPRWRDAAAGDSGDPTGASRRRQRDARRRRTPTRTRATSPTS